LPSRNTIQRDPNFINQLISPSSLCSTLNVLKMTLATQMEPYCRFEQRHLNTANAAKQLLNAGLLANNQATSLTELLDAFSGTLSLLPLPFHSVFAVCFFFSLLFSITFSAVFRALHRFSTRTAQTSEKTQPGGLPKHVWPERWQGSQPSTSLPEAKRLSSLQSRHKTVLFSSRLPAVQSFSFGFFLLHFFLC
jgi:hypothetical protein